MKELKIESLDHPLPLIHMFSIDDDIYTVINYSNNKIGISINDEFKGFCYKKHKNYIEELRESFIQKAYSIHIKIELTKWWEFRKKSKLLKQINVLYEFIISTNL